MCDENTLDFVNELQAYMVRVIELEAENERLLNLLRDCDPESMSWLDARDAALEETK